MAIASAKIIYRQVIEKHERSDVVEAPQVPVSPFDEKAAGLRQVLCFAKAQSRQIVSVSKNFAKESSVVIRLQPLPRASRVPFTLSFPKATVNVNSNQQRKRQWSTVNRSQSDAVKAPLGASVAM